MTLQEFVLRVLYALRALVPAGAAVVLSTLAVAVVLYLLGKNAWFGERLFLTMSLFFGLDAKGRLRLACCWMKLVLICFFIVAFQELGALHYWTVFVPGILAAFLDRGLRKWLEGLFWLVLQMLGLVAANVVCRFVVEMAAGMVFILIYAVMGLFLVLLSIYLFLTELVGVSSRRDVLPQEVWGPEETE